VSPPKPVQRAIQVGQVVQGVDAEHQVEAVRVVELQQIRVVVGDVWAWTAGRGQSDHRRRPVDADHLVEAVDERQGVAAAAAAGVQGAAPTLRQHARQPGADGISLQVVQSVVAVGQRVERLPVGAWGAAVRVAVRMTGKATGWDASGRCWR
jgi:hypothetical protein